MAKTVDEYIEQHSKWKPLLELFREVLLSTELEESIKWGAPYYSLSGKNVVSFMDFKNHAALWFTNGVFLDDPENRLINASEGLTKVGRQLRFNSFEEADKSEIQGFVNQAIKNQKAGIEHKPERKKELEIPPELENAFKENDGLEKHFESFTPYKKREFADHISQAKQAATKERRLKKIIPMIFEGRGLYDKHR